MGASDIETVPRDVTAKLHVNGNGNGNLLPSSDTSDKSSDAKTEDTPATSPDTVHLSGDLKMSLDEKAPVVQQPYSMAHSMVDLPCAAYALELFLASHMLESEEYMHKGDPQKCVNFKPLCGDVSYACNRERLYFATGYGLIQCVKALLSYDDKVSPCSCTNICWLWLTLS